MIAANDRGAGFCLTAALSLWCAAASCPAGDDTGDAAQAPARPSVVVVIGAPGTDEYAVQFRTWAEKWRQAADKGAAQFTLIGDGDGATGAGETDDRTRLAQSLAAEAARTDADALWLVLIGHGSFDGETAKFNLRGPDVTVDELAAWLAAVKRPAAVIDCASASAPLINAASAEGRVVIAATKSGFELNFARFGEHLAAAIADPAADLDKDDQTSLLEAYLTACRGVAEFYSSEQRLATEHALLDDNGDSLGTPAAWFRGLRATQSAKEGASLDGLLAHQLHLVPSDRETRMPRSLRERRDELERSLAELRMEKPKLVEEEYYLRLELLMVELARLYHGVAADSSTP